MSQPFQTQTRRLRELDALRGIAAIGVVLWHDKGHFQAAPLSVLLGFPGAVLGWVQLDYANPVSLGIFRLLTLSLASLSYPVLEVPAQQISNRRWNDRKYGR